MTLSILWEEYIAAEPGGYRYSRFCELYRAWAGRLSVTMRQSHAAGDKLFVDYAGDGVPVVVDRLTGERRTAQVFVAVLGASNFTYAQATWTQGLADWISAHVGTLAAIDGVPALLVPDNTKVAVIKASLYDPQINRTYPPRQPRLPRRGGEALLQRPASLRACRGRGAVHRPHRRDLPQGRADCRASAHERQSQAHHRAGAHGLQPSPLRRLDHRAHPPGRRRDRPGDQRVVRPRALAPRAGVPRLSRHPQSPRPTGASAWTSAAARAIDIGARTYGSVKSILANNLDRRPAPQRSADDLPILHSNIRGPRYYN